MRPHDLYPIDDIDGNTYLVEPHTIAKIVPYGLNTKIYTYEVFGSTDPHEVIKYVTKKSIVSITVDLVGQTLVRYQVGSYLNVRHIECSNGYLVKHAAGIDVVHKLYRYRLASLYKEHKEIEEVKFGIAKEDSMVRRMLP